MKKLAMFILVTVFSGSSVAQGVLSSAKIEDLIVQGENIRGADRICVYTDKTPVNRPGCNVSNRFCASLDTPLGNSIQSIAMFAKATNADIAIAGLGTCNWVTNSEDINYIKLLSN